MEKMNVFEVNKRNIETRVSTGIQLLQEHYVLKEKEIGEFRTLHIQNMDFAVRQFEVVDVGNLVVMENKNAEAFQMDTFVLTPYFKDLPLYSSDYMYIKENRNFLNEIYSLVTREDEIYLRYIDGFQSIKNKAQKLPDMPVKPCWYDNIRPVCVAKATTPEQDGEVLDIFYQMLKHWILMEQECKKLSPEDYKLKWKKTKEYSDRLVDDGGVSTDVFKATLGPKKTKQFFQHVFFAPCEYEK